MNSVYMKKLVGNTVGRKGWLDPVLPLKVKGKCIKIGDDYAYKLKKIIILEIRKKYPSQRLWIIIYAS